MRLEIPRLYDSHTHFLATGEFANGLRLEHLKSAEEVCEIQVQAQNLRGSWLTGFGWDDSQWATLPHKDILDRIFPDRPVYFNKRDGHSSWVNSQALKELGLQSATGVLSETEHLAAWDRLPSFTKEQMRLQVLAACRVFNNSGFTHVRDMSGSEELWSLLTEMESRAELSVALEMNFTFYNLQDLQKALHTANYCKANETSLLRSKGVKFFFDGSLGSDTAFLSQPYYGDPQKGTGRALWELTEVEEILKETWRHKLEASVHVIGDEAAHQVVQAARKVSAQGFLGRLNLEHVQVLRPETIQMMKPLHVRCHMQPCHWLSDRRWLKEKLRGLYQYAFPWEALRAAQVPLSFGCDSPIEAPSFLRNKEALQESPQEGIRAFRGDILTSHSHPDSTFANSQTVFADGKAQSIRFNGRDIL